MLKFALYLAVFVTAAPAWAVCQWSIERTEDFFTQALQYMQKPKIEKTACRTGVPPVCMGYIYCPDPKDDASKDPKVIPVACPSVPAPGGKWRCPKAQLCFDDVTIDMLPNKSMGAAAAPAAPAAPATPAVTR